VSAGERCRFFFRHNWKHTMTHGGAKEQMCTWCKARQVSINGVTLSPEESATKSAEMWESARAVMWLLDNVEPDYTAGRAR